jgi:hypothetical protein
MEPERAADLARAADGGQAKSMFVWSYRHP